MIPLSIPSIQGNEWQYVKECLDTGWVSSAGRYVDMFEQKICEYTGSKHAIACINGTSALQVSLLLAGVKAGNEVIVPTITFIAPVNAIQYLNATPVFMDADEFYNIDIQKTIRFLEEETCVENGYTINRSTEKRIVAVIPVHVFGNAVNLEPLAKACKNHNIRIIEDATESLGSKYRKGNLDGRHCGTVGDIGCLSFNGNKIITTGGGGMILTDNAALTERAKYLTTQAKDDASRYIHNEVGYNFRMTNVQAAIGVAQLEQLPECLKVKEKTFRYYKKKMDSIPGLKIANVPEYADNNHWMIAMQIDKEIYGKDRETVMAHLAENGIETRPVWYLNHLQKPYKKCQTYKIEKAFELAEKTLNIPCSVNLKESETEYIIKLLRNG